MPIVPRHPRHPFWDLERFFEERGPERPGRLFRVPEFPVMRGPKMDIYETAKEVVAEVELPGVDPKNIEVEVRDNALRVEAKREEKKEEKKRGYYRKELSKGYYKRVVPLPVEVQGEKAKAVYEGGMLKVSIPKAKLEKKKKGKKVEIKVKTA